MTTKKPKKRDTGLSTPTNKSRDKSESSSELNKSEVSKMSKISKQNTK